MPVIELRQYTLKPGRRDELIALFEREFVESQEATGIHLIAQFRDLDAPDRFVWLRAFESMAVRKQALETFYGGPIWQAHRDAANATMIDSDDVLLLRPLDETSGFPAGQRGSREDAGGPGSGVVVCGVHRLTGPDDPLVARLSRDPGHALRKAGLAPVAVLITHPGPNNFPGLPVREGEWVLVWFAVLPDEASAAIALTAGSGAPGLEDLFKAPLQLMRLVPTARSRLQG